jgi:hypothetical protein
MCSSRDTAGEESKSDIFSRVGQKCGGESQYSVPRREAYIPFVHTSHHTIRRGSSSTVRSGWRAARACLQNKCAHMGLPFGDKIKKPCAWYHGPFADPYGTHHSGSRSVVHLAQPSLNITGSIQSLGWEVVRDTCAYLQYRYTHIPDLMPPFAPALHA